MNLPRRNLLQDMYHYSRIMRHSLVFSCTPQPKVRADRIRYWVTKIEWPLKNINIPNPTTVGRNLVPYLGDKSAPMGSSL